MKTCNRLRLNPTEKECQTNGYAQVKALCD